MKRIILTTLAAMLATTLPATLQAHAQTDQLTPSSARLSVQAGEPAQSPYQRGTITSIYLSGQGSDNFAKYRGTVTLDFVGTGTLDYTWGGSTCPGRDLSAEQVQILVMARAHDLKITPEHKRGQGGALCLTGFALGG
ncbi:hypothetical protein [Aquisalinus flavus]|uniref:Uncharacterized protein n=1 Tax=Aquisalinus flavus TaxID=1526572 RepID=A0A8J2Y338_9PROT|nr:hypothetical protein [Aquisalinus flavus]MBD0427133.1 hypothetical protein [Aquisalinus flavus]UNE46953.1 hypothetical protein FF099_02220 [Aquisalinus flavus]GGC98626.1 hypothetical protein GCM10011342_04460 [Aquisalinus flavus]